MISYIIAPLISIYVYMPYKELLTENKEEINLSEVFKTSEPTYIEVEATFYTARCKGCIGITKTGHDVRNTIYQDGKRVIAVDPNLIPLHSLVLVELENGDYFEAIASDTGGDIKNNRVDILVKTREEAYRLGRQKAKITILEEYND